MKVKEESENVGLKLNIQKTKIMASGPITPWEIDGETVETVSDFIFLVPKSTADGDCSHEIKRHLLLGRESLRLRQDSVVLCLFFFSHIACGFVDRESGPITSRQIDGETMETVTDFIFLSSKITADGDCSHEIKRRLLLRRKVMRNLDNIFKSRDITFPTKVHLVKVFPVVMYGCESWTMKKAESRKLMLLNCGVGEDS